MASRGVQKLYAKFLAPNDNSKNQPYFGGDFSALNILPIGQPVAARSGNHPSAIFKAPLSFGWLAADGNVYPAPDAKLILYPQYPEIRFSGYLRGCANGPSREMGTTREPNRLLLLGVAANNQIIGFAALADTSIANEVAALKNLEAIGVFLSIPIEPDNVRVTDRVALLRELCRIAKKEWIVGKRLDKEGTEISCNASNCGGATLEAELGIRPNSSSDPDFRGWEIKQYSVRKFGGSALNPITLMTPEPSAGYYSTDGAIAFVGRYGAKDKKGRFDRLNFTGAHRCVAECAATGLTLHLLGYDTNSQKISDTTGGIALVDSRGREAAKWPYAELMAHWTKKHANAAYVPSMVAKGETRRYRFASRVLLGTGTDFLLLLSQLALGFVYYDPGISVENFTTTPVAKRRSQFRVTLKHLPALYHSMENVEVCGPV